MSFHLNNLKIILLHTFRIDLEDEIHSLLVNTAPSFPSSITSPSFSCSLDDFQPWVKTNKKFYFGKLKAQLSKKKACEPCLPDVAFTLIAQVHI